MYGFLQVVWQSHFKYYQNFLTLGDAVAADCSRWLGCNFCPLHRNGFAIVV